MRCFLHFKNYPPPEILKTAEWLLSVASAWTGTEWQTHALKAAGDVCSESV